MNEIPRGIDVNHTCFFSPLGWILAAATDKGICLLQFLGPEKPAERELDRILGRHDPEEKERSRRSSVLLDHASDALQAYFSHGTPLPNLSLDFLTGTPFQRSVWNALCRIPHGETRTYAELAAALGCPKSFRAVGQACGKNPVAVLVPCHRVVASSGRLGGYSGGLHIKRLLLEIETSTSLEGGSRPPGS